MNKTDITAEERARMYISYNMTTLKPIFSKGAFFKMD